MGVFLVAIGLAWLVDLFSRRRDSDAEAPRRASWESAWAVLFLAGGGALLASAPGSFWGDPRTWRQHAPLLAALALGWLAFVLSAMLLRRVRSPARNPAQSSGDSEGAAEESPRSDPGRIESRIAHVTAALMRGSVPLAAGAIVFLLAYELATQSFSGATASADRPPPPIVTTTGGAGPAPSDGSPPRCWPPASSCLSSPAKPLDLGWVLGGGAVMAGVTLLMLGRRAGASKDLRGALMTGVGVGLMSMGGVTLAKDLTFFKDVSLIHSFGINADSLVRLDDEPETAGAVAAVHWGAGDLSCDKRWEIGPFEPGWERHLEKEAPNHGPRSEPPLAGAKLTQRVATVTEDVLGGPPADDDYLVLIGSTDARRFETNGDLALRRANEVRELIPRSAAGIAARARLDHLLVLNGKIQDGVARLMLGADRRDTGRVVIICRFRQPAPAPTMATKPVRPRGSTALVAWSGLLGLVVGAAFAAVLAVALAVALRSWKPAAAAPRPAGEEPATLDGDNRPGSDTAADGD